MIVYLKIEIKKKKNGKSEWGGCKSLIGHSSKPNEEKKRKEKLKI